MFLFFEDFQPQNVPILFLFSIKHSDLLSVKITSGDETWNIR